MFAIPESVIHEEMDGETMLVRLDSGNYYTMNMSGGQIWALIERGASKNQIVSSLSELYGIEKNQIEEPVDTFLKYLIVEELVVVQPSSGVDASDLPTEVRKAAASFEPPQLHKYSDMQELLILDPIHEVSDAGWPHSKPQNDSNE
ncbi:MAG TPA: PqqD family peptide modification chaperone [Smithella sp.]|nr:PqqD family peptide modification chaperone [Smithella sp.]